MLGKRKPRFEREEVRRALVEQGIKERQPGDDFPLGLPTSVKELVGALPLDQKVALKRWLEKEYL
jgi:hypothetical protein